MKKRGSNPFHLQDDACTGSTLLFINSWPNAVLDTKEVILGKMKTLCVTLIETSFDSHREPSFMTLIGPQVLASTSIVLDR